MSWNTLGEILSGIAGNALAQAAFSFLVGLLLASVVGRGVARMVARRTQLEPPRILQRLVFYLVVGLTGLFSLSLFGFDVGVLLGAAGVLTVAVGFAAQTSFSNIISGLFLIAERPFKEGDFISVGAATGRVHAIDLLAVTLRTSNNLSVRVPNEIFVKEAVTNYSRFPIRRIDFVLGVSYGDDLERVMEVVLETVQRHQKVLEDPAEEVFFEGFGDSSVLLKVTVWVEREAFFETKRELGLALRRAFAKEGLEFPFPQRTLHMAPAHRDVLEMLGSSPPPPP